MEPDKQSDLDQSCADIVDMFCPMWRRMFNLLVEEQFTESESLKLVQTYILSQCPNGIRGSDG